MQSEQPLSERLALAWQLSCQGQPDAARLLAEEARHAALADGQTATLALANEHLAWFCVLLSRLEDGLQYAQLAASLWRDLDEAAHEAVARATLAWLMSEAGDDQAITEAQRAVALADQASGLAARAFSYNALCVVLWMLDQHDLAEQAGLTAVALAREHGDPVAVGRWLNNLGLPSGSLAEAAAQAGDDQAAARQRHRAIAYTREAASICASVGDGWGACIALCNLCEWLIGAGALDDAAAALRQAAAVSGPLMVTQGLVISHMQGMLLIARGETDAALPLLQQGLQLALDNRNLCIAVQIAKQLSDTLAACGRFEEALVLHRQFFDLHVRRSNERTQVRARTLSRQSELESLRLRAAQFERLSIEDPLTGLANRRRLDLLMREIPERHPRYGVGVIDVDNFKRVNDRLSHLVGDEVLRRLGLILAETVRAEDTVGRFGGEEFVLLMCDVSEAGGHDICERLRLAVEAYRWDRIDPELAVTVSIGVAVSRPDDDMAAVLALADNRLLEAKRRGRNRVIAHAELPHAGIAPAAVAHAAVAHAGLTATEEMFGLSRVAAS